MQKDRVTCSRAQVNRSFVPRADVCTTQVFSGRAEISYETISGVSEYFCCALGGNTQSLGVSPGSFKLLVSLSNTSNGVFLVVHTRPPSQVLLGCKGAIGTGSATRSDETPVCSSRETQKFERKDYRILMATSNLTLEDAHQKVREEGVLVRNELLGKAFLEAAGARGSPTPFLTAGLDLISEVAFGTIWTRSGLERKERSLITITLLATLGRSTELAIHTAVGRRNGLTEDEIKECLLQVMVYAGIPTGYEAFRVADGALKAYKP